MEALAARKRTQGNRSFSKPFVGLEKKVEKKPLLKQGEAKEVNNLPITQRTKREKQAKGPRDFELWKKV